MSRAYCLRPRRLSARFGPLPVSHEDALALRQKADANFAACLATSDRFFDRCHPCDEEADAALDAALPHVTNDGLDPFLLKFLGRPDPPPVAEDTSSAGSEQEVAWVEETMSDEASSASLPFTPASVEGGGSSVERSPPPVGPRV